MKHDLLQAFRMHCRGPALGLALGLLAACGGPNPPSSTTDTVQAKAEDESGDSFDICSLLSAEQVSGVLPGSDGGTAGDGGGSLMEGVDSHQCAYTAVRDGDIGLLTVLVLVASTDELFAGIEPGGSAFDADDAVPVGDGGWKKDDQAGEFGVVASKGRSVLRLELMTADAQARSQQMIELAQAVAARL